jgi:hypothetical protein
MSGPSDNGDGDDDAPDDPRVRDLLSGRASSDAIDPETAAKLASWFDLPSFAQVEELEAKAQAAAELANPNENPVAQRRRAAMANVDPGLLAHVTRHDDAARALRREPLPSRWEGRVLLFDEQRVPPAIDLDDLREVHIPPQLRKDLKTCTPQASLRDLHRPDKQFFVTLKSPFEDQDEEPVAGNPMEPVRAALRSSHRVGVIDTAGIAGTAQWIALQRTLAQPWAESKRERARKREVELLAKLEAEAAAGKAAAQGHVVREPEEAP